MDKNQQARINAILKRDHLPRKPIAAKVQRRIRELKLSRAEAALRVKDAASQLSRLMTGHVHEFSADRLVGMARDLGGTVEVRITFPKGDARRGRVRVT